MLVSSSFYTCPRFWLHFRSSSHCFCAPESCTLIPTLPWGTRRTLDSIVLFDLLSKLLNRWLYPALSHEDFVIFFAVSLAFADFFPQLNSFLNESISLWHLPLEAWGWSKQKSVSFSIPSLQGGVVLLPFKRRLSTSILALLLFTKRWRAVELLTLGSFL